MTIVQNCSLYLMWANNRYIISHIFRQRFRFISAVSLSCDMTCAAQLKKNIYVYKVGNYNFRVFKF